MGRLAMRHRKPSRHRPPAELLEPFIERTPNHWYWLGEFYDDGLDRGAEFRWAPYAENLAYYAVPRLLWHLANPDEPSVRALLENTCGLFTCINPAHWAKRRGAIRIPARIVLPEHVEAMPVMAANAVLTVHIRRVDSINTVCGHGPAHQGCAKTAVITCDDCINAWVRTNQPFTESK